MRKRLKILIGVLVVIVVLLISDAVIVNFTAPVPSSQTVSTIEHSSAFEAETMNATYTYLGYDNGRTSPIHCGPVSAFSPIQSLILVFWRVCLGSARISRPKPDFLFLIGFFRAGA